MKRMCNCERSEDRMLIILPREPICISRQAYHSYIPLKTPTCKAYINEFLTARHETIWWHVLPPKDSSSSSQLINKYWLCNTMVKTESRTITNNFTRKEVKFYKAAKAVYTQ